MSQSQRTCVLLGVNDQLLSMSISVDVILQLDLSTTIKIV